MSPKATPPAQSIPRGRNFTGGGGGPIIRRMRQTRRTFLKAAAAGMAMAGAAPAILRADDSGGKAGEKKTVALIGAGWWGTNILSHALADGRVKVVALCDVDQSQLKKCSAAIEKLTSDTAKSYGD